MRTAFLLLVFFMSFLCFSQNKLSGFYQVVEKDDGTAVTELETGKRIYINQESIFDLKEIEDMQLGGIEFDGGATLFFELDTIGTEKLRLFTQKKAPTKIALVLESKVMSNAQVYNEIPNGTFELSTLDIRKSKAILNRLNLLTGRTPIFSKDDFLVYTNRAKYKDRDWYNSNTDYDVFMSKEAMVDTECQANQSSNYNPLSLIGNFYSYEYIQTSESACGPMGSSLGVRTIDYTTGAEVTIQDFFNEVDFVTAFKKDRWVVNHATEFKVDINTIKTFDDIFSFFNGDAAYSALPTSFSFVSFKNGLAKIRFFGVEYLGYNHSRHLQLGFEIKVKKEMLLLFEDSSNFYLGRYKNSL
jgi:hypothetical protein